ncbi:TetR family transcriptional regulator C-terminal domain-containing protein [Streptomyces sp. RTd22]|uniref:TetR family transcriptional regulator C-terminal domain-containing protein n=1 Tax=Streptomyces sp. RTd22 TaxID=1841249 RepID=UPI0007C5A30B|nr:TetR family transcriptional regulator C-terminal domain-containing protein [Streptomyces sp. RTd22]
MADTVLAAQEPLLLEVDSLAGIDRWFDAIVANGTRQDAVGGCATGSLASQLSGRDDLTRQAFVDAFARWEAPLIAGLRRMQESGELRPDADVTELADLTMAAIQGGLLLAQVRRTPGQLRLALRGARAALEDELTPPCPERERGRAKRPSCPVHANGAKIRKSMPAREPFGELGTTDAQPADLDSKGVAC